MLSENSFQIIFNPIRELNSDSTNQCQKTDSKKWIMGSEYSFQAAVRIIIKITQTTKY